MAFGRIAGELRKHRKGDRLAVMGTLQRNHYQPRDGGEDRESSTVSCDSVLGPRSARPSRGRRSTPGRTAGGPVVGDRARQDRVPFDDAAGF